MAALVLLAALLVGSGPVAAETSLPAGAVAESRSFSGTGSVGSDSSVEFYLLAGTYQHSLESSCVVAAGVFPADREPAVPLGDVLPADLATGQDAVDIGTFAVSAAGWANVQLGTGPDCEWEYVVTGAFLPVGDEPPPPRSPDDVGSLWGLGLLALFVVFVVLVARTRRTPGADDEPEIKVRVTEPPH